MGRTKVIANVKRIAGGFQVAHGRSTQPLFTVYRGADGRFIVPADEWSDGRSVDRLVLAIAILAGRAQRLHRANGDKDAAKRCGKLTRAGSAGLWLREV